MRAAAETRRGGAQIRRAERADSDQRQPPAGADWSSQGPEEKTSKKRTQRERTPMPRSIRAWVFLLARHCITHNI